MAMNFSLINNYCVIANKTRYQIDWNMEKR